MVKIVKKTDLYSIGADDDGSGTMTIFEAYRGLISAGFLPKRTVEFHFYSAEVKNSLWQVSDIFLTQIDRRAAFSDLKLWPVITSQGA